jgi:lipoyl(octanoyl) transferase
VIERYTRAAQDQANEKREREREREMRVVACCNFCFTATGATNRRRDSLNGKKKMKKQNRRSAVQHPSSQPTNRTVKLIDLSDEIVPYELGWQMQKDLLQKQFDMETAFTTSNYGDNEEDHIEKILFEHDALIVLQHEKVITLGTGSTTDNLKFDMDAPPEDLGFEVHRCERGGEVTVHLPGQLVLYPILKLDERKGSSFKPDLHEYMRNLEEVALLVAKSFGVENGHREDGLTGAWASGTKFAQVGVRARRWVTYHGLAINVDCNLHDFTKHVVPCGIGDRPVGSIKERLRSQRRREEEHDDERRKVSVSIAADRAFDAFEKVFDVSLIR